MNSIPMTDDYVLEAEQLHGFILDWCLAKKFGFNDLEGRHITIYDDELLVHSGEHPILCTDPFSPSTNKDQLEPYLKKYEITFGVWEDMVHAKIGKFDYPNGAAVGSTFGIAACRAIVSGLGEGNVVVRFLIPAVIYDIARRKGEVQ